MKYINFNLSQDMHFHLCFFLRVNFIDFLMKSHRLLCYDANRALLIGLFCTQLTVQSVASPHLRPPEAYSCCVSVLHRQCQDHTDNNATVYETGKCKYSGISATGRYALVHECYQYCFHFSLAV